MEIVLLKMGKVILFFNEKSRDVWRSQKEKVALQCENSSSDSHKLEFDRGRR